MDDGKQVEAIENLTEAIKQLTNLGYAISTLANKIEALNETLKAGAVRMPGDPPE